MSKELQRPFDSIESALEFMELLEGTIHEASAELEEQRQQAANERTASGLSLAVYKTRQLALHVQKSRRILNDLALIRGALLGEHSKVAGQS
ncbi:MAG TPA: hypothetical protein VKX25_00680 [Bryobacteraceae bacterium]|jgi:hypothetical protein|nr:hypothetical protein [Bryobacteraceae bacterium]